MSDYALTGQILAIDRPAWRTRSKRLPGQAIRGSSRQGKASASPACPGMLSLPGATLPGRTLYNLLMRDVLTYHTTSTTYNRAVIIQGPDLLDQLLYWLARI